MKKAARKAAAKARREAKAAAAPVVFEAEPTTVDLTAVKRTAHRAKPPRPANPYRFTGTGRLRFGERLVTFDGRRVVATLDEFPQLHRAAALRDEQDRRRARR